MSGKNAKIIIILVVVGLILAGFIYYYFFLRENTQTGGFIPSDTTGLFPSGRDDSSDIFMGRDSSGDNVRDNFAISKYRKISQKPISGGVIVKTEDKSAHQLPEAPGQTAGGEKGDKIRYMDRATGHIYETWTLSGEQKRISNTTIPKVYETLWNKEGDSFIARYLEGENDEITSYFAKFKQREEVGLKEDLYELDGYFLSKNILNLSVSPAGKNIVYVVKKNGSSFMIKSDFNGKNASEIFNFPITGWTTEWFGNSFLLKTKPAHNADGYVYKVSGDGNMTKILGNIKGLTTLGKSDGTAILFSESFNNSFNMYSYDTGTKEKMKTKLNTLPEKCVWSKKDAYIVYCAVPRTIQYGEYPDDWYKGNVSFDDVIWIFDTKINLGNIVADPRKYSASPADAINLALNEDENYLMFTNKKDLSLWGIDMTSEPTEIIGD